MEGGSSNTLSAQADNVWHQQAVSELASKTSPLVTALLHAFDMPLGSVSSLESQ